MRALSDDPKAKIVTQSGVGVIIVGPHGEIVRSANILPPQVAAFLRDQGKNVEEDDRYHLIEHAERAAIYQALIAGHDLKGATIYCTRFPCSDCARAIIWTGIKRVVLPSGFAGEARWIVAQRAALSLMRSSGIKVRYLPAKANISENI